MIRRTPSILFASAASAAVLALAGCTAIGSETPGEGASADGASQTSVPEGDTVDEPGGEPVVEETSEEPPAAEEPEKQAPKAQAASCEWDIPRVNADVPATLPSGQDGDLSTAIIGSWQHTHFDAGSGFEALDGKDIRYVFSSDTALLYCQDVPGVTDRAENGGAITWDGTTIVLPGDTKGYTVTAWSESTMLWSNHFDGSTYLLQRR